MSNRPANSGMFTQEQVIKNNIVLENHFKKGMKSTTCSKIIQKAAEETSLPVGKIKVKYRIFCTSYVNMLLFVFRPFDYVVCIIFNYDCY